MPTSHIGSHARAGTRSGLVAGCVLVAAAGDLLLLPLMSLRAASFTLLVLAALGLYHACHDLPTSRSALAESLRRASAAWAFGVFVAVLLLWSPIVYLRSPDAVAARAELTGLLTGVLLAAGVLAASRTSASGRLSPTRGDPSPTTSARPSLGGWRLGWTLGLGLALVTAAVELLTGRHVHADESLSWTLDPTIVAGPFRNPNDFAAVLVVLVSGTIAYRAGVSRPAARLCLAVLAAFGVVAVFLTQSRGGLVAVVLVLAIHAARVALDRRAERRMTSAPGSEAASGRAHTGAWAAPPAQGRGTVTWAFVVFATIGATIAAFTVPALTRLNPVATMITAAGEPGTARSDTLRLDLIRAGWRYFTGSDHLGTGAGSFEYLLAHDPNPGVSHIIWMHNSFLELLLQYGVVVAAALGAVITTVLVSLVLGLRQTSSGTVRHNRERRLVVAESLSALVGFAALGSLAYTALETHAWWMMLAQAVAGAWWLTASRRRPSSQQQQAQGATDVAISKRHFSGVRAHSRR